MLRYIIRFFRDEWLRECEILLTASATTLRNIQKDRFDTVFLYVLRFHRLECITGRAA